LTVKNGPYSMSFLGNDAINRVNLYYAIYKFAEGAGGVFLLAFLLRAGVPVPLALCAHAAIVGLRFVMRPGVVPLARRFGIKPVLIAGVLVLSLQYLVLARVSGVNLSLVALCLVSAVGNVLTWSCFHAYFAAVGDAEHRGKHLGAREALSALVAIVAPLVGAWGLVTAGPAITFAGVAIIQSLSVLPLIGAPNVAVPREAPDSLKTARIGAMLGAADGWFAGGYHYVWLIALFVTLGESFTAYGGAMAMAAFAGAVCSPLIGRLIDGGNGRRALVLAYGVATVMVTLRAASLGTPWLAVGAHAMGALVIALWIPTLMTPVYNLAKASPCPLRFHVANEAGWDLGCGAICLVAAGLSATGWALSIPILLSLVGGFAGVLLLWRRYGAGSGPAALTTQA
jgi:hypothetical protein